MGTALIHDEGAEHATGRGTAQPIGVVRMTTAEPSSQPRTCVRIAGRWHATLSCMDTTMRLVSSTVDRQRVIHEIDTFESSDEAGGALEMSLSTTRHELPVRSRAQAEQIASAEGHALRRDGDAWESLPFS